LIIGAVYGPNHNDGMFYANLERDITALRDHAGVPVVLGGDWNSTWDGRESNNNIDVINMVTIPSKFRTDKLNILANKLNITDPFRYLHPSKVDFSYVPNDRANTNRSRIDFF
jgi:exonuclease III